MKQPIKDITITDIEQIHFNIGTFAKSLSVACMVWLLCICAVPVQHSWGDIDIILGYTIAVVAIIGTIACFLSKGRMRISVMDGLVVILYGYFIIRYYADATYPAESIVIHAGLAIMLYFSFRILFTAIRPKGNVVALIILMFATYETFYGIIQLITGTSRHSLYLLTGSFNNPGPYSACIVMGLAIAFTYMKYPELAGFCNMSGKLEAAASVVMQSLVIIFISITILTTSRTAFIAAALCLTFVFSDRIRNRKWTILGICIAISVGLYFFKPGSANGRFAINCIGLFAVADNPLFGCGVGGFFNKFAESTELLASYGTTIDLNTVDVIEYAFNNWLRITVELGIVGLTIAAAIVIVALRKLWKDSLPLFLVLLVILVFSFLSYPMELLPYKIITIMVISYVASQSVRTRPIPDNRLVSNLIMTIIAIVIIGCSVKSDRLVNTLANAEKDYSIIRGINDPAFIKDYAQLLPMLKENGDFLSDYARILAKANRYNDSNDILRMGTLISNNPMFLILQGNNYLEMEAYEDAEQLYLKAWHTMPNRI